MKSNQEWKEHLKALGWSYLRECASCSGRKLYYRRGTEMMAVYPNRDYYQFTQNGEKKTGKLSKLGEVVKATGK